MAGDQPTVPKPEAWWGSILAGAREHATTQELWQAIKDYATEAGVELPPNMFAAVNQMRALASGLAYSSEQLGKAAPGDALTHDMMAPTIYSGTLGALAGAPLYHVRFEMTTVQQGVESTDWYTLEYPGSLPATVGDLMDELHGYADDLSTSYGVALVGLGRVEISVI